MPRNSDPIFWPDDETNLSLKMQREKQYTDCINILQTQWYQADLDQRFTMGDQDLWGLIYPGVATYRRKLFNFNIINPIIQLVSGFQRRNRKSTICIPVLSPMQKTADQLTKCLFHVHKQGAYQVYSDAFEQGALIQGLGFVSVYLDYTSDPISPDIRTRYIDMKSCLFDPYFRKHDASDMRFFNTRQFFDRKEAAMLYPQFADEIMSLPRGGYKDDKFYYMPEVYQIQTSDLIAVDEYWYLTSRVGTFMVDVETQECQEINGTDEQIKDILRHFKKRVKIIKQPRPTYRRSIILNDRIMVDEANPYGIDRLPYVPYLGYFSPDSPYYAYKFKGITRDLRDPQYLFNRRKVADLDILESQQQGLKVKKGALVTPSDSLNSGNGKVLTIDPAFQMDDVQHMDISPPSPVMLQMEDMLKDITHHISGVNETLLGTDINDKAGIISALRQSAGITTLTRLFDQCDEAQRLCGDLIVEMIQQNWKYGKVKQVIGEDPTFEFDKGIFFKYGAKIVQGALTETQQQLQLQQLLYFRETTGIPIPSKNIIEAAVLQDKDALLEGIMEQEKAQQEQQQKMAQLQMQQLSVDTETKLSYARSQDGLAEERKAKISTDIAVAHEKLRKSHQEDNKAMLDFVKTLKELQGMDVERLGKRVEILGALSEQINPTPELVGSEK